MRVRTGVLALLVLTITAVPMAPAQGMFSEGTKVWLPPCQEVAPVAGITAGGDICVTFSHPQWATSSTAAPRIATTVSGPPITAGIGVGVDISNSAQVGCTTAPGNWVLSTGTAPLVSGFGVSARAVLTMSSNECQAVFKVRITLLQVGVVVVERNFEYAYAIYVQPALAVHDHVCNADGLAVNAFNPTTTTCTAPTVNVDVVDDSTDDGMLTTPAPSIGNVTANTTVALPDVLHLCGAPVAGNASSCQPVAANAYFPGTVDAPNLSWILVLVFLSVLVGLFWWLGMAFTLGWSVAAFIVHILPVEVVVPEALPVKLATSLLLVVVGVVLQYLNEKRGEQSQAPEDRQSGVV